MEYNERMWIIYAIQIISVISIIFLEHKKPFEALLWVIVVSVFPLFGFIIYFIFGSTLRIKLEYRKKTKKLNEKILKNMENYDFTEPLAQGRLNESQCKNISFNERYFNSKIAYCDDIEIITSGKEKYDALYADIASAKESINIVYYGFHSDKVGKELVARLTEKAKEGVKVRVLCDGIGSLFTSAWLFRKLIRAGGEYKKVKSIFTHFRNHRKIAVIDHKIGYMGGMNIGEKYLGKNKAKTPWRDTQVRLIGSVVSRLEYCFYYDW